MNELRDKLRIPSENVEAINAYLTDPNNTLVNELLAIIERHGGVERIEARAAEARKLENQLQRLREIDSPWLADLEWLAEQKERGAFISVADYRAKVLGPRAAETRFDDSHAVTLEVSACQYMEWVRACCTWAIEQGMLVPGRFIRVRSMKEQEGPDLEVVAFAAAMNILGASWVETLDTRGTDGSNVHLGGPETITGYFGGVGQPNRHALQWVDELLHHYTEHGVQQVLNINPGTVMLGYILRRLGVNIEFKISVFMGNDNPYAILWTLLGARLFAGPDGDTPLIGFNFSNSVDNETIELSAEVRRAFGFTEIVRFEHHITETWKSIVRQPYNRREELLEIAGKVKNISAKHEGGDPETEAHREHPSDILDYFLPREEIDATPGLFEQMTTNFLDKCQALNLTAWRLTEKGLSFKAADVHHEG
jgi:hypothetical protein